MNRAKPAKKYTRNYDVTGHKQSSKAKWAEGCKQTAGTGIQHGYDRDNLRSLEIIGHETEGKSNDREAKTLNGTIAASVH